MRVFGGLKKGFAQKSFSLFLIGLYLSATSLKAQDENSPASHDFINLDDLEESSLEKQGSERNGDKKRNEKKNKNKKGKTTYKNRNWQSVPSYKTSTEKSLKVEEIVEPSVEYHYSTFGQKSPFDKPNLSSSDTSEKAVVAEIPVVSLLQRYPLTELQVKGIWVLKNGEKKSLVMTPNKRGVIVKEGDPISAGKVLKIYKRYLLVRQYSIRADGVREFEDSKIYLGRDGAKKKSFITLTPGAEPKFDTPRVFEKKEKNIREKEKEKTEAERELGDLIKKAKEDVKVPEKDSDGDDDDDDDDENREADE